MRSAGKEMVKLLCTYFYEGVQIISSVNIDVRIEAHTF